MANNFKDILNKAFNNYLDECAVEIKSQMVKNIEDEKDFKRKGFRALKKSTQEDRVRNNYSPKHPILIRTGGLRDSIRTKTDMDSKSVRISSTLPYADDLNDGTHSGWGGNHAINANMPPRRFLEIPKSLEPGSNRDKAIQNRSLNVMEDKIISSMNTRLEEFGLAI